MDIRWVGAYQQADGRMRVTVSFYGRVRNRWFNRPSRVQGFVDPSAANLAVGFTKDRTLDEHWAALFLRTRHKGLIAWLCEYGSSCSGPVHVDRPDRRTIRARLVEPPPSIPGPAPGWYFRGISRTHDLKTVIDRTHWGVFT
jgi:hypothetical protein